MDLAEKLQIKDAPLCILNPPKEFKWDGPTSKDPKTAKAEGARIPGGGKLKAIEDAPGRYVKER